VKRFLRTLLSAQYLLSLRRVRLLWGYDGVDDASCQQLIFIAPRALAVAFGSCRHDGLWLVLLLLIATPKAFEFVGWVRAQGPVVLGFAFGGFSCRAGAISRSAGARGGYLAIVPFLLLLLLLVLLVLLVLKRSD
jgi:hypothetical protein